jgi:hypothetical protein
MRAPEPTVVLVPGVGLFSFGKNKPEARITAEFYTNAIHVMEGATALAEGANVPLDRVIPQSGGKDGFAVTDNYVALPPREAFNIEYWSLEEAKLRRMPRRRSCRGRSRCSWVWGPASGRASPSVWRRRARTSSAPTSGRTR